jgi:polar amino acid transport system permease protein
VGEWQFIYYFEKYYDLFIPAAWMTVKVTVFGILIGILLGLVFSLMRISKVFLLNLPARAYIWVIRGTPLLLQLWIIYYGFVNFLRIDGLTAAFIALGVHNGAYIAEIFRGAIESVDRGQREAGISLGMTRWRVMRRIILPQAFKRAVPALSNQFIIALKDSSLASTIAVPELLLKAKQIGSSTFRYMELLAVAGVYYLIMTTVLTIIANAIERRLNVSSHRT